MPAISEVVVRKFVASFIGTFVIMLVILFIVVSIDLILIRKTIDLHTQTKWFSDVVPEVLMKKDKNLIHFSKLIWQ